MSFYRAFARTFWQRPRVALAALYWHMTGRRVRARNRLRMAAEQAPDAYDVWIRTVEAASSQPSPPGAKQGSPLISVILHLGAGEPFERSLRALEAQDFADWELVMVGVEGSMTRSPKAPRLTIAPGKPDNPGQALSQGVAAASGAFLLPLPEGAVLPPHALARHAEAIAAHPAADVLYGDEDRLDRRGRRIRPWFKSRWNGEMFLAQDYLSGACVIRASAIGGQALVHPSLDEAAPYELLLSVTGVGDHAIAPQSAGVVHIPHVLAHLPDVEQDDGARSARVCAVRRRLGPVGATARMGPFGTVRVEWPLPETDHCPKVSVIIPTRDRVDLLRSAVFGVLDHTNWPNLEVIVVDNGSQKPEALEFLRQIGENPKVTVLRDAGEFNFSRLNNRAAACATGAYLCLLNNDVEMIGDGWLKALMRQAIRPGAGAVGAKLLYDDGSIQHAGVVIGMGDAAGHAHRFQKESAEGWFARAHIAHEVSAVTAACLVVDKRKFEAVGGLDETAFAVAFNDVDLCLKLRSAGWHNIYEPQAVLIHHESKSRGRDTAPRHIERYRRELAVLQQRWRTVGHVDPLFHPSLDRVSESYCLRL